MNEQISLSSSGVPAVSGRLGSLDVLRGFDMFWIVGGSVLLIEAERLFCPGSNWISYQMGHASWQGFRFYDLIFPMFVFIAGISTAFAAESHRRKGVPERSQIWRLLRRTALLILLGVIYNRCYQQIDIRHFQIHWEQMRFVSVLGLIGLCTLPAALMAIRVQKCCAFGAAAAGIFLTVWGIQSFLTVDGYGNGSFEAGSMINSWFDQFLPGRLHNGTFDPEGLLNIFSAAVLPLYGCAVGRFLIKHAQTPSKNVVTLSGVGLGALALGYGLDSIYPVIKNAWTGSFNLMALGYALLFFTFFYALIDWLGFRRWGFVFQVIGLNAITVYLLEHFGQIGWLNDKLFGSWTAWCGDCQPLLLAFTFILIEWIVLDILRRRKIFLKV